jgi:hypothetical protein
MVGQNSMATIKARVENLEKRCSNKKLHNAVYFVTLPKPNHAEYQQVQDDIIKRSAAGQKVIVFEIIDALHEKRQLCVR